MSGIVGSVGVGSRSGIIGQAAKTERIGFAAKEASSLTLASSTWTSISFTQLWDLGGCYDGQTFTAPVTGKYLFNGRVRLDSVTEGDNMFCRLLSSGTDGTYYTQLCRISNTPTEVCATLSAVARMDANDTMVFQAYNASGARGALVTNDNTGFDGWFIGY